ncbi:uncharacterized protein LOC143182758 [Calliopsis andreniformis]|uniref:uncharacterized protein LOC143182758 n=1 Tax=Calliopsis andreniformis TaxID=337506 RepID=UPI003FCCA6D7
MSKDGKFFVRPKVRFCQADTDESKINELKNKTGLRNTVPANKPRIRSIVTLDKPVKLITVNAETTNQENNDLKINNAQESELLTLCSNAFPSCKVETFEKSDETENEKPIINSSNIENSEENPKKTDAIKISEKPINDDIINPSASSVKTKTLGKVLKSQNTVKANISKKYSVKVKKGKENETLTNKKDVKSTIKTSSDPKLSYHKTKSSLIITKPKIANVTSKSSVSVLSKKVNSKSNSADVMPCYKYNKTTSKVKTPLIKKTVIRDIIGHKIKPYIGPGVSRKREDCNVPDIDKNIHVKACTTAEKLARPEYNSIMCTINKLNEMKKQKDVTDIEHLPATYKNVINGKISNALDFPLDEAIYKNLVDLSIDEKQLPNRLTRSKDPESRQRDAVPVLSDFFTPEFPEEYCTFVSIKPRIPEIADTWNAFRISDKIFEWKYVLDHV